MRVLFWGLFIFFLAFFIHLLIWKIRIPKGQTKTLLKLFIGILVISLFCLRFIPGLLVIFPLHQPEGFLEYLHIALLVVSLALFYITNYSAIEADSPSLVMVMNIAKKGRAGLSREELFETNTDEALIKPRVRDLLDAGFVCTDGVKFKLSKKASLLINVFIFYRKLLKLPKGG